MAKKQEHLVMAPVGGLRHDLPAHLIGDMEMTDCRNVTILEGELVKRYGYGQIGSNLPLSGACIGGDFFELFSGVKKLIVGTVDDVAEYNATSGHWEYITQATELEGCDSGWAAGSGDTVSHDTSDKLRGTGSMKLTLAAQRSDGDLLAYKDITSADISAHTSIGFWIQPSIALAANALEVVISESNHAAGEKTGTYTECLTTALAADTWTFVRVTKTLTDYDAVVSVSLFANTTIANATIIRLDDVRAYTELTGDDNDYMESTVIRDINEIDLWWIFTNGVDPLKKYTGSGTLANLITTYPSGVTALLADQVLGFKNHLHLFGPTENGNYYPTRVRWSDTADPGDFLNGNASFQDLNGADAIKRAVRLGPDAVAVIRKAGIWVGQATGDSDVFSYRGAIPGLGTPAGRTVQYVAGRVFFMGWDNVYTFDGANYEAIGRSIKSRLFRTINMEQADRAFGMVIETDTEYWLCVPVSHNTYCYDAYVYNYDLQRWVGHHEFADPLQAGAWYQEQTALTIGDLQGTIGDQDWRFADAVGTVDSPAPVLLDANGYVFEYGAQYSNDDDAAIDGWFDTKDFVLSAFRTRQTLYDHDVYFGGGGALSVSYSTDRGSTFSTAETLAAQTDYSLAKLWWKVDCLRWRLRFRNNTSNERFKLQHYLINWAPAGKRKT